MAEFIPFQFGGEIRVSLDGRFISLPTKGMIEALLKKATREGAEDAMTRWQEAAIRGIDGIHVNSSRYLSGIGWGEEFATGNGYQVRLRNDWSKAPLVEAGYEKFDMLPGLLRSPQARRNKKGEAYLIVPFRWGTPRAEKDKTQPGEQGWTASSMPKDMYAIASKLEQSRVTEGYISTQDDPNVRNRPAHALPIGSSGVGWNMPIPNRRAQLWAARTGEYAPLGSALRRRYQWGGRVGFSDLPSHLQALSKPWHAAPLFQGMVRMDKGEGTKRRYSNYLTFRIAHQNMLGSGRWQHPGQPPKPISQKVAAKYAEEVAAVIQSVMDQGVSS